MSRARQEGMFMEKQEEQVYLDDLQSGVMTLMVLLWPACPACPACPARPARPATLELSLSCSQILSLTLTPHSLTPPLPLFHYESTIIDLILSLSNSN